jgi:hypothetical protein
MPAQAISCASCSWPLDSELWNRGTASRCPSCGQQVQATVYPAVELVRTGVKPEALLSETEASCFFHPQSRALAPCDQCGRFLCGLCDLEIDGRHMCPACLVPAPGQLSPALLEPRRTMFDTVVLLVAILPILLWPFLFISAPTTLFLVVRYWRKQSSLVKRTKIRFVIAAVIAVAEMVLLYFIVRALISGIGLTPPTRR